MMFKDRIDADFLKAIGRHVEVLNYALRNVPADRCRMHVCWGNYEGPHHCDVEMAVILPTLLAAKPAACCSRPPIRGISMTGRPSRKTLSDCRLTKS